ncbi:uncharacterized protein LOC143282245 [Babylonia areolata]|uniref:uncharacterized protein LOC143282245 n=1 Tax=Babylonia areolata TaxID=304850 RepID=UPI003FD66348
MVNPGRFSVTPAVPINNIKVGDVLLLNCSGSVGTITPDTQVELVWEYKNNDDTSWIRVKRPNINNTLLPLPNSCKHMTTWSVLKIVLDKEDNGRRYRCFLKKDGDDLEDDLDDDDDTHLIEINSPFNSVLTINPRTVTLFNADKETAVIICKALQSQNKLISLVLSFKATQQNVTLQPKELAITDQPKSVISKVEPEKVSVTGGIVPRAIYYNMLEVTCADAGTYVCTAVTELATETRTDSEEKTFDVKMSYFETTPKRTVLPNGGMQLTCSTLIRFDNENQDVKWHWQSTPTDPKSGVAAWTDISPTSKYVTVSDTTITPSHRCFVVSTSTLTVKDTSGSAEEYFNHHRCFVSDGDTNYDSTGSEFGTDRPLPGSIRILDPTSGRPSFSRPSFSSRLPSFSRPSTTMLTEPSSMVITTSVNDDDATSVYSDYSSSEASTTYGRY